MFWKQLHVSILLGAFLGTFCAVGYLGLPSRQGELVEIEPGQATQALGMINAPIREIEEGETVPEKKNSSLTIDSEPVKDGDRGKGNIMINPKVPIDQKDPRAIALKHRNKGLNNYNIMFLGIENKKLQMLTVYSINEENNWKSGTVFIPTDTLVPGTSSQYIADYFYQNGPEKLKQLVEKEMEINISYFVKVDRNLLMEVEPYLDPIYVDGKKINLAQLFTKEITPQDEKILASLLKNLTQPSIYFGVLPKLVLTCKQYINTDFELNWPNLWVHYQIAKNIDTSAVTKKIISGRYLVLKNKKYWIPTQDAWWNMVYNVTS